MFVNSCGKQAHIIKERILWTLQTSTQNQQKFIVKQGWIWNLLRGGANPEIVSLKQGSGGHSPPEAIGYFILHST